MTLGVLTVVLTLFVAPPRAAQLASWFVAAGRAQGLDPALLAAVAWQESRLDAQAQGRYGEWGVMQLLPQTRAGTLLPAGRMRQRCNVMTLWCQRWNINEGARILQQHIRRCGALWRGVSAYNGRPCRLSTYSQGVKAIYEGFYATP